MYGRKFSLITDHKPLSTILSPNKGIPSLAAARMQRWALLLSAYTYDISYRPTKLHANADALSRLPLSTNEKIGGVCFDSIFNLGQLEALPLTAKQLALATSTDSILSKVLRYTQTGWPSSVSHELKPYFNCKHELTIEGNCVMWGIRVLVPLKYRSKVLNELHQDHPGISRMKAIARSHVWWPGVDSDIDTLVKSCEPCLSVKPSPPKSPLNPWLWPAKPWVRIHVDFAGPLYGKTYFIIVDAHSKWPEVFEMTSTTTSKTIDILRQVFAAYGLPDQLVSDNGPQFSSEEFQLFLKCNGIKHCRTAPYRPATNGAAERFVQTLKKSIMAGRRDKRSDQHKLSSFLLKYRSTPHAVTGVPPSTLFLNRHIKTVLDLLKPDYGRQVLEKQSLQKQAYDGHSHERNFMIGDDVMVKIHRHNCVTWQPGTVVEKLGPVSYIVNLRSGSRRRCHIDQILRREVPIETSTNTQPSAVVGDTTSEVNDDDAIEILPPAQDSITSTNTDVTGLTSSLETNSTSTTSDTPPSFSFNSRYPTRNRKPPDRYF